MGGGTGEHFELVGDRIAVVFFACRSILLLEELGAGGRRRRGVKELDLVFPRAWLVDLLVLGHVIIELREVAQVLEELFVAAGEGRALLLRLFLDLGSLARSCGIGQLVGLVARKPVLGASKRGKGACSLDGHRKPVCRRIGRRVEIARDVGRLAAVVSVRLLVPTLLALIELNRSAEDFLGRGVVLVDDHFLRRLFPHIAEIVGVRRRHGDPGRLGTRGSHLGAAVNCLRVPIVVDTQAVQVVTPHVVILVNFQFFLALDPGGDHLVVLVKHDLRVAHLYAQETTKSDTSSDTLLAPALSEKSSQIK